MVGTAKIHELVEQEDQEVADLICDRLNLPAMTLTELSEYIINSYAQSGMTLLEIQQEVRRKMEILIMECKCPS
jgi:hypothetical protein